MKTRRLAIIPARGGSKRIKKKNIKQFLGKPIISYSIETALKSNLFSKIHVSTDSLEIKKISEKNKINIDFMRPKNLANDNAGLIEVLKFVANKYKNLGYKFDEVWLIMPCSPLINYKDLIKASKIYKKNNSNKILLSISEYNVPIQWSYKLNKNKSLVPNFTKFIDLDSKKIKKSYHDNGSFVIYNFDNVIKNKIFKNQFIGYEIPKDRSIDIDDELDWNIAEALYLKKNKL